MKFPKWTLWICYFSIAYMPFMLVSTRAHYIVDIIAAPLYTHVTWHIHELFKKELDYLWSIPYVIFERIYSRYFKEEETDNKLIDDNLS